MFHKKDGSTLLENYPAIRNHETQKVCLLEKISILEAYPPWN